MAIRPQFAVGAFVVAFAAASFAVAPTQERVLELCANVEGPAHCGRRVEAEQLKALPNLAVREGDTLRVSLYPSGTRAFVDTAAGNDEKSYALWDYWSPVNAIVLFVTSGDEVSYAVLQRATGQLTVLPAEPMLAPDRQHAAVADFCPERCTNEISVWRITRDGLRKDASFKPAAPWSDVTVGWKSGETVTIQFTPAGGDKPQTIERPLTDREWRRS